MAKYSNIKAKINEKIATNGRQAVTGAILNDVLQTMVDSLGADYQFGGLVQPGSSFTAGEQPVVFLATTPGTYTNFGRLVVAVGEVALLVWSGTAWSKQTPDISTRTEVSQLGQELGQKFIPLVSGDVTDLMGFRRGLAQVGQEDINYDPSITTRLVSQKITANTAGSVITIHNNNSGLKVIVARRVTSTGKIEALFYWSTDSEISFNTQRADTDWFAVNIAKTDDADITPDDLTNFNVTCSGLPNEFVLYSDITPNVDTVNHKLDLGSAPIFQIRPNTVISLSSVLSSDIYRNIDLTNNISRYSIITYNIKTNEFSSKIRSDIVSGDEIILGTYDAGNPVNCKFNFHYTINGIEYGSMIENVEPYRELVSNKGVFEQFFKSTMGLQLENDITELLNFVNGVVQVGATAINYFKTATRLISFPISPKYVRKITVLNRNDGLKYIVYKQSKTTGEYSNISSVWENGTFTFFTDNYSDVEHFLIYVGKTNDGSISASDLTDFSVLANSYSADDEINGAEKVFLGTLNKTDGYINPWTNKWVDVSSSVRQHVIIPITNKNRCYLELGQDNILYSTISVLFLGSYNVVEGGDADVLGLINFDNFKNNICHAEIPDGTQYIYIQATSGDRDYLPASLVLYLDYASVGIMKYYPKDKTIPLLANLKRRYFNSGGPENEYPPVLSFIHCSDIHADNSNILRIADFFSNYSAYIQNVIDTGDFIGGSFRDGLPSAISDPVVAGFIRIIGNHDTMNREGTPPDHQWVLVNQKDCYDQNLKDYIGNWGVVQPENAATSGCCYYYKDYASNCVRLIALDSEHWSTEQKNWLIDVLEDARTQSTPLHVIIGLHTAPFIITKDASNPFSSIDYTNVAYRNLPEAANAVKNFIDAGGFFIAWICGHIHDDFFGVGLDSDYSNQLVIGVATAGVAPATPYSSMAKNRGCKNQDCFNVVGIDTTLKVLKILRIGADYDRYMRHKGTLCWDYDTKQLIYVD